MGKKEDSVSDKFFINMKNSPKLFGIIPPDVLLSVVSFVVPRKPDAPFSVVISVTLFLENRINVVRI